MKGESISASSCTSLIASICSLYASSAIRIALDTYTWPSALRRTLNTVPYDPLPSLPSTAKSARDDRDILLGDRGCHHEAW